MKILLDGNETEKKVDSQNLCEEMNEELTGIQRTVHTKIGQLSQVVHDCNNKTTKNFGTLEDKINKIPKKRDFENAFGSLAASFSDNKRHHSSTDTETFHAASNEKNYFSPETTTPITTQQQNNESEMVTQPVNLQDTNIVYPSINVTVQTNTTITNTQVTTDVGDTALEKKYIQPLPIFISDKNYNKIVK